MHVSALDVQAFRPQKALHLNPVLTIAELQDELRAIGQNNLIIVVNVVTVRGGRNVKWEVGKDPMDSRLVPEGWNQNDVGAPFYARVLCHAVHDRHTWMAAFNAGMEVRDIPDRTKCVGTPINYSNGLAFRVLYDAWRRLPTGDREAFTQDTGLRVLVGARSGNFIVYHEGATLEVWNMLINDQGVVDHVPELVEGPISLVEMCQTQQGGDIYRMSIINVLFNDVGRRMVQPDEIVPEIRIIMGYL